MYLKGWSGLDPPEAVKLAAEVLRDSGWVRSLSGESGSSGGRPSNRYEVNPRVWECPKPMDSKLGSVGFEGAPSAESTNVEAGPDPAALARASAGLNRAGVRILALRGGTAIGE